MVSVVIPIYNERESLKNLHHQLSEVMRQTGQQWELILVDDGSRDGSFEIIRGLSASDPHVKGVRFSRNFGQYPAVVAGIDNAQGDAVIIMDADLQEPPSLIPQLIAKWQDGYKAVYTSATKRNDSWLRSTLGSLFYRFFGEASYLGSVENVSEMRLLDKEVVNVFRSLKEKPRFIKGMFFWLGFDHVFVQYEKQKREAGVSKYSIRRLIRLAFDGILSFSFLPLKAISYVGCLLSTVSIIYGIVILALKLFSTVALPSYSALLFAVMLIGGIQLLSLGVIGEYLGRIYDEVRQRPRYIVEERVNFK